MYSGFKLKSLQSPAQSSLPADFTLGFFVCMYIPWPLAVSLCCIQQWCTQPWCIHTADHRVQGDMQAAQSIQRLDIPDSNNPDPVEQNILGAAVREFPDHLLCSQYLRHMAVVGLDKHTEKYFL